MLTFCSAAAEPVPSVAAENSADQAELSALRAELAQVKGTLNVVAYSSCEIASHDSLLGTLKQKQETGKYCH